MELKKEILESEIINKEILSDIEKVLEKSAVISINTYTELNRKDIDNHKNIQFFFRGSPNYSNYTINNDNKEIKLTVIKGIIKEGLKVTKLFYLTKMLYIFYAEKEDTCVRIDELLQLFSEYYKEQIKKEPNDFCVQYENLKKILARDIVEKNKNKNNLKIKIKKNYFCLSSVEIKTIESVKQFLEILQEDKFGDKQIVFRGQSDSNWGLTPSLFRNNYYKKEDIMYKEIVTLIPNEFSDLKTTYEKLIKMQHYEYPTRLLDLTSNPLIALYFTCEKSQTEENNKCDGRIFLFEIKEDETLYYDSDKLTMLASLAKLSEEKLKSLKNAKKGEFDKFLHIIREDKPYFIDAIQREDLCTDYFVRGIQSNQRITNQSGSFIILGLNKEFGKKRIILNDDVTKKGFIYHENIVHIISKKKDILKELEKFNITKGTVYPNFEKIADYLKNQKFINIK